MLSKMQLLFFLLVLACHGVVHADKGSKVQARINQAKINLTEAIAIAQERTQAQAYEAELEENSFSLEYEVELISERDRYKVIVDAITGEVKRLRKRD